MSGDIVCDEAGTCKLDLKFGKMAELPRDLIPLSSRGESSTGSSSHTRTLKKQIKRGPGNKSAIVNAKVKPRGRPPKTAIKKIVKRLSNKQKKDVKVNRKGRPPTKK